MEQRFVHLHLHTEFSLVDGLIRIEPLIKALPGRGMHAVAITDHCNLFAAVKLYKKAKSAGIKPIIGCEIQCYDPLKPELVSSLILLCQNEIGYKNLTRIVSKAYQKGQYHGQPRVQYAWVPEFTEGLALKQKKQLEDEKRRLKDLAEQKDKEAKRIAELKKEQDLLKKQKQLETEKLAELKLKQAADKAKAEKALAEQEKARQAEAKAVAQASAENLARMRGEVDKYKALILNAIGRQWILPDNVDHSMSSQFRIHLAPDGAVIEVSLIRSSGDPILDRSAQTAIYKASPLPVPADPASFNLFRDINLTVRPEQVRG